MTKLTKRQSEVLNLIQIHMEKTGSPPTRAEIAKTMGFRSPNAAEDHLRALAKKGVIELIAGTSRGIRLIQQVGIPVLSAADELQSIESDSDAEPHCRVERTLFQPSIDFFVRIKNQNLKDMGILEGDYLAVHRSNHAEKGQVVVLKVEGELIPKRFSPDNQTSQILEGIGVGVIRPLLTPSLP